MDNTASEQMISILPEWLIPSLLQKVEPPIIQSVPKSGFKPNATPDKSLADDSKAMNDLLESGVPFGHHTSKLDGKQYAYTGSKDGPLKRWLFDAAGKIKNEVALNEYTLEASEEDNE